MKLIRVNVKGSKLSNQSRYDKYIQTKSNYLRAAESKEKLKGMKADKKTAAKVGAGSRDAGGTKISAGSVGSLKGKK